MTLVEVGKFNPLIFYTNTVGYLQTGVKNSSKPYRSSCYTS
jgi:hypothetical protein